MARRKQQSSRRADSAGLARALREAVEMDPRAAGVVPSTKGAL